MLRVFALIAMLLVCCATPVRAADCVLAQDLPAYSGLKRGINLSRWWENDRHQALWQEDIAELRKLGFDFVRLPISPKRIRTDNDEDRSEIVHNFRCDLISLLNQNLAVVVDLHAAGGFQSKLVKNPGEAIGWLEMFWGAIQPALKDLPPERIFISIYNEPQIDADTWWPIQGRILQDMRVYFPKNTFIATAGPDGGPWNLGRMEPYSDQNVIYDFHFYQPMFFTHHGANWFPEDAPERSTAPITYPSAGTKADEHDANVSKYKNESWDRDKLGAFIKSISEWAKTKNARIACLEFGVFRPFVDAQSRTQWIADMRELLEQANIPWAMWEYRGNFGLINDNGEADKGVIKALGLAQDGASP